MSRSYNRLRRGRTRTALNIAIVWLLTGFWHGSAWTFLARGGLYTLLLLLEKFGGLALLARLPRGLGKTIGHIYTLFFVVVGFVLFNGESLTAALDDIGALFGAGGIPLFDARSLYYARSYLPLIAIASFGATPLFPFLKNKLFRKRESRKTIPALLRPAVTLSLLLISISFIASESFRPFLYFRF